MIPKSKLDEKLSRGEAMWVVEWLVNKMKKPAPRGGFYAVLRKTPAEVAKEYNVPIEGVMTATRR